MKIQVSRLFFLLLAGLGSLAVSFSGCTSDANDVSHYFNEKERDTLLVNVITYMDRLAPGANSQSRFESRFRKHYVSRLPKYSFERFYRTADSTYYYFVVRPVGDGALFQRGVGGKFRLKNGLMPTEFEEMWCTPHFKDLSVIKERGGFLFRSMVQDGNVDKYLTMRHYVEWPDSTLRYDKKRNEWVSTVGLR